MTDIIIGQLYIFFISSFYSITTITKPSIVNFIPEILDLLLLIYSNSSHFCMELVSIHISLDELLIVALGSIERYLLQFFIIYSYLVIVLFFNKFHYFYVFYFQLVFNAVSIYDGHSSLLSIRIYIQRMKMKRQREFWKENIRMITQLLFFI
jgi:hypothetical protein